MKLTDLLRDQQIIIQLIWGDQKIEFSSVVVDYDESSAYVTPYMHNGSPLKINVTNKVDVNCNVFTNNQSKQRVSWKNVELTTVERRDKTLYCLKTSGYNHIAKPDERRLHERVIIQVKAEVFDGRKEKGVEILVHDISDIGISFHAPKSFAPTSKQLIVTFTDSIDDKQFNIRVGCTITRTTERSGNLFVGCKIMEENKDFRLYGFMKRLYSKKNLSLDNQ